MPDSYAFDNYALSWFMLDSYALDCCYRMYNVQKEDEGRYICTATSESGIARDYSYLRVSSMYLEFHKSVIVATNNISVASYTTALESQVCTWSFIKV